MSILVGIIVGTFMPNEDCPSCICPEIVYTVSPCPTCPDVYCYEPTIEVTEKTNTYTTKIYSSHFENIIQNVASLRPYLLDEWDCTEFTQYGIEDLQNAGYDCREVIGYYENEEGISIKHAYGECDNLLIEFTYADGTGKIIQPSEYFRYGDYCRKHRCI